MVTVWKGSFCKRHYQSHGSSLFILAWWWPLKLNFGGASEILPVLQSTVSQINIKILKNIFSISFCSLTAFIYSSYTRILLLVQIPPYLPFHYLYLFFVYTYIHTACFPFCVSPQWFLHFSWNKDNKYFKHFLLVYSLFISQWQRRKYISPKKETAKMENRKRQQQGSRQRDWKYQIKALYNIMSICFFNVFYCLI